MHGRGYDVFDEGAIFEDLKVWMTATWTADSGKAEKAVDNWNSMGIGGMGTRPRMPGGGDLLGQV